MAEGLAPMELDIPGERKTQRPCLTNLWVLFFWGITAPTWKIPSRLVPDSCDCRGVQTPLGRGIIGHQCLVNLTRNWLATWTGVLIATDWGISSAVTSDAMHCFLKWMTFLTLVLIRCSRRILMQVTLVDPHALWVSTVPTGLHASSRKVQDYCLCVTD